MKTDPKYLTESKVGRYLINKYGDDRVKKQFRLPNNTRVDYLVSDVEFNITETDKENLNIIVEFDGNHHYQQWKTIERDIMNQQLLINSGYHVIHIPYFVQAEFAFLFYFNTHNPEDFYGLDKEPYGLGFVDKNCVHPIDFSMDGWSRFVYELLHYPSCIREEIRDTMTDRENSLFDTISENFGNGITKFYDSINWMDCCMFG